MHLAFPPMPSADVVAAVERAAGHEPVYDHSAPRGGSARGGRAGHGAQRAADQGSSDANGEE